MRWDRDHFSNNVEDRRGQGPARAGMGVFGLLPYFARFGWKGIAVFAVLAGAVSFVGTQDGSQREGTVGSAEEQEMARFVGFVLDDVQATWQRVMPGRYRDAKLVLFRGATQSACGLGQSQMGPFYCPADQKVYIDLVFYRELHERFGAPGDFAQAYVIGHEIGHHVQHLLGKSGEVHEAPEYLQKGAEGLSVKLELQADCYAGVWAHDAQKRNLLEAGDVDEALAAAAAIGDDRLQKQSQGRVTPETWSHGSAAQRAFWFKRGLEAGKPAACDTFAEATR